MMVGKDASEAARRRRAAKVWPASAGGASDGKELKTVVMDW
jgi:hypothetical protein